MGYQEFHAAVRQAFTDIPGVTIGRKGEKTEYRTWPEDCHVKTGDDVVFHCIEELPDIAKKLVTMIRDQINLAGVPAGRYRPVADISHGMFFAEALKIDGYPVRLLISWSHINCGWLITLDNYYEAEPIKPDSWRDRGSML